MLDALKGAGLWVAVLAVIGAAIFGISKAGLWEEVGNVVGNVVGLKTYDPMYQTAPPKDCEQLRDRAEAVNQPDNETVIIVKCAKSSRAFVRGIVESCRKNPSARGAEDFVFIAEDGGAAVPRCER